MIPKTNPPPPHTSTVYVLLLFFIFVCKLQHCDAAVNSAVLLLLLRGYFHGGFIFVNFVSQFSRNFHFNTWLFIVMKTSQN